MKTEEKIDAILKASGFVGLHNEVSAVSKGLDADIHIKWRINGNEQEEYELKQKFEKDTNKLRKELVKIQADCPHFTNTYYPDAAGGSDSHTTCDTCGKEL